MAGLTVAVTGPTGEIGRAFVRALERSREVARIVGMARRPFDPAAHGWKRTEYRRGDVLDRGSVEGLVEGADVVVHLAFVVVKASSETRHVNVEGSRNVFEAAVAAGAQRLVYSSSVAAYGFPENLDGPITEDVPALGHARHPYSAHKAEVEEVLDDALSGGETDAWVFRPCIVAGPDAPALIDQARWPDRLPGPLAALAGAVGVLPDPGVAFQLVHHDDVATALRSGVLGRGDPGAYNLAGAGEITMRDVAGALGYRTVPMPRLAVDAAAEIVAHLPFLPEEAAWVEALRRPVLMDTAKARRLLRWRPRYDAGETLRATVSGTPR
jgi:nucleoside-diphosphate-sugar epimerase